MSRTLLVLVVALSIACAKGDPFDEKVIAKDLKSRTPQDLYEKAQTFQYDPPPSARLTEAQTESFIRMLKLAARIRKVADSQFGNNVDRANTAENGRARFADAMAAFGSLRTYATSELRAALNLGLNPKEEEWVGKQLRVANVALDQLDRMPSDAAERWNAEQDPAFIANVELVRRHREELKEWMP
ncbi:MAG TPA: hypothetical protein VGJ82_10095 [Thermoanaerobaculia bacterium]